MRKYVRKIGVPQGEQKTWTHLYAYAVEKAEAAEDPRVRDLKHWSHSPEQALRRLGILTERDVEREFKAT